MSAARQFIKKDCYIIVQRKQACYRQADDSQPPSGNCVLHSRILIDTGAQNARVDGPSKLSATVAVLLVVVELPLSCGLGRGGTFSFINPTIALVPRLRSFLGLLLTARPLTFAANAALSWADRHVSDCLWFSRFASDSILAS